MRLFFITLSLIMIALIFTGCHAAQEKAWDVTMETTRLQIAEDEFLSKNVDRIELERRQFIRVYINPQHARSNFAKITVEVTKIAGDTLFAQEGNSFKEITVFGNFKDGDEIIVCKYKPDTGAIVEKDRSMHTM